MTAKIEFKSVFEACETLGRKQIADSVGVGVATVSDHIGAGLFPGSWFVAVRDLAADHGYEAPERLFRMKRAQMQEHEDAVAQ